MADATLLELAAEIQETLLDTHTGLRRAPDVPPEQMSVFPFAVCYPDDVKWTQETLQGPDGNGLYAGLLAGDIVMRIEVHIARRANPYDVRTAIPYGDSVPREILKRPRVGDLADVVSEVTGKYQGMAWGGVETVGWRFQLRIHMTEQL